MKSKRGIELQEFGWWILALLGIIIIIFIILLLSGKMDKAIEFIKNMFRFRLQSALYGFLLIWSRHLDRDKKFKYACFNARLLT